MLNVLRRVFSFSSWTVNHPLEPPPGDMLDASFDAQNQKIAELEALIEDIRRSDGRLQNDTVTYDSLRPELRSALGLKGPPVPGQLVSGGSESGEAEAWADTSRLWAEHMPDTIPDDSLAEMDISGDHWSSRWWAHQASLLVGSRTGGVVVSDTPPPDPHMGILWWSSVTGDLHTWYIDQDSAQWVKINTSSGGGVLTPEMFGAIGDGITDDTLPLQAAIDAAGAVPCADVHLAGKTYKITATLDIPYANVSIIGGGSDIFHTAGGPQGGQPSTKIKWGGAHGGIMMHFRSPEGATPTITGGGVKGVYFDSGSAVGNDGADIGLRISSRHKGWYEDLFFFEMRDVALLLDTVTTMADDRGCAHNVFFNIGSRNAYRNMDGGFIRLQGDVAVIPGDNNCNVYMNMFFNCRPVFNTGTCYNLYNTDNNRFYSCGAGRILHSYLVTPADCTISLANPCVITKAAHGYISALAVQFISNSDTLPAPLAFSTPYYVTVVDANTFKLSTSLANRIAGVFINTSAGSQSGTHKLLGAGGKGIIFHGSSLSGYDARYNLFRDFSGGDEIYCEGTEGGLLYPSHDNNFEGMEVSNATPLPTLGTGATSNVMWRTDGSQPKGKFIGASFGGLASMGGGSNSLLMSKVQARMVNESLRITNTALDHIRFEYATSNYDTVTYEWALGVSSAGEMRLARSVGSAGHFTVTGGGIRSVSTNQGIGYGAGSGSTVTQATSKATLISMARVCGLITTAADALAANTSVTFQWNCSLLEVGDVIIFNHDSSIGGTAGAYTINARVAAAAAFVTIRNVTAGSLSEAIGIRFAVIKGVVA